MLELNHTRAVHEISPDVPGVAGFVNDVHHVSVESLVYLRQRQLFSCET